MIKVFAATFTLFTFLLSTAAAFAQEFAQQEESTLKVVTKGKSAFILDQKSGKRWIRPTQTEALSQEAAQEICENFAPKGDWALPTAAEMQDVAVRGLMEQLPRLSPNDEKPFGARLYWMSGVAEGELPEITDPRTTKLTMSQTKGAALMRFFYPYPSDHTIVYPHNATDYAFPTKNEFRVMGSRVIKSEAGWKVGTNYIGKVLCVSIN